MLTGACGVGILTSRYAACLDTVQQNIVAFGTPETFIEAVGGVSTEVVRVGAPGDAPLHLVFVPGNPGVPGYYSATAERLGRRLQATVSVRFLCHTSAALVACAVTSPQSCRLLG